jgi:hypothetical protein
VSSAKPNPRQQRNDYLWHGLQIRASSETIIYGTDYKSAPAAKRLSMARITNPRQQETFRTQTFSNYRIFKFSNFIGGTS